MCATDGGCGDWRRLSVLLGRQAPSLALPRYLPMSYLQGNGAGRQARHGVRPIQRGPAAARVWRQRQAAEPTALQAGRRKAAATAVAAAAAATAVELTQRVVHLRRRRQPPSPHTCPGFTIGRRLVSFSAALEQAVGRRRPSGVEGGYTRMEAAVGDVRNALHRQPASTEQQRAS